MHPHFPPKWGVVRLIVRKIRYLPHCYSTPASNVRPENTGAMSALPDDRRSAASPGPTRQRGVDHQLRNPLNNDQVKMIYTIF